MFRKTKLFVKAIAFLALLLFVATAWRQICSLLKAQWMRKFVGLGLNDLITQKLSFSPPTNGGLLLDGTSSMSQSKRTTSLLREDESLCLSWEFPKQWEYSGKPTIVLDPDKCLYPGLLWGPNNQVLGLKQSIYLAIRLNRTLAIPMFVSHRSSGVGEQTLPPHQVIDVQRLCRFLSCVPIPVLRTRCDGAFDVALQAMAVTAEYVRRFEQHTGMSIINVKRRLSPVPGSMPLQFRHNDSHADVPALPSVSHKLAFTTWLPSDGASIRKVYNTSARCAIYTFPYKAINTSLKNDVALPLETTVTDASEIPDDVLYSAVTDAVRHAPCVVEAARDYVGEVLKGEEYVGVHWRYNLDDWHYVCGETDYNPLRRRICKYVFSIYPKHVARGIALNLTSEGETTRSPFIYIATPPSLKHFRKNIYQEFRNHNARVKEPTMDVEEFVRGRYARCWEVGGWSRPREVISMVEMEVMVLSDWFFYSDLSTWSENVLPLRRERFGSGLVRMKYSAPVFEVAFSQLNHRRLKHYVMPKQRPVREAS